MRYTLLLGAYDCFNHFSRFILPKFYAISYQLNGFTHLFCHYFCFYEAV